MTIRSVIHRLLGTRTAAASSSPMRVFPSPLECYEAIAQELAALAPSGWVSFDAEATLGEGSVNLVLVSTDAVGNTESNYDPVHLDEYFWELRSLVSTREKGFYRKCRFKLLNTGEFNAEFEYA